MITQETIKSATHWYDSGVRRIRSGSYNQGQTYLDKAIAVFQEIKDIRRLTYALHFKLLAYKLDSRFEEIESQFPDVMDGYTLLEDTYGKSLLFCHLAESLEKQDRHARAIGYYNLAAALAEREKMVSLWCYILENHGGLYKTRRNQIQALHLFELAEDLADDADLPLQFTRCRMARALTLMDLGEQGEAQAMLEDVQVRMIHNKQFREAVEVLSVLRRLYEYGHMDEDRNRVVRLMHVCGQQIVQTDSERRGAEFQGPPIDRIIQDNP